MQARQTIVNHRRDRSFFDISIDFNDYLTLHEEDIERIEELKMQSSFLSEEPITFKEELLEINNEGVNYIKNKDFKSFENLKISHPDWQPKFVAENLYGMDFKNTNLEYCEFFYCNLSKTNLKKALIKGCLFNMSVFQNTDLEGIIFNKCCFPGTSFRYSNLKSSNFNRCHCPEIDFESANLCGADLEYAEIRESNFRNTQAKNTKLKGIYLEDAFCLDGANFTGCSGIGEKRKTKYREKGIRI